MDCLASISMMYASYALHNTYEVMSHKVKGPISTKSPKHPKHFAWAALIINRLIKVNMQLSHSYITSMDATAKVFLQTTVFLSNHKSFTLINQ